MSLSPENLDFDVIICGGGPGGSTCALAFHASGLRVAVIEKSEFPREKVCGDGIAPYVPKTLEMISPKFRQAFENFEDKFLVNKILFSSYNGQIVTGSFPESYFIATRYHLDNFLYDQAKVLPNIRFFLGSKVQEVEIAEDGVQVITDKKEVFRGKIVIGCDGATSVVRRHIKDYQKGWTEKVAAVRAYYTGVTGVEKDRLEVYFLHKYPQGYCWVFPSTDDQVNVGIGLLSDEIIDKKINLRELLTEVIEENPLLKKRFANAKLVGDIKGWSIPFSYKKLNISGNRFMLVGDAAGIADPFSGEGIGQAIVTGRIAAWQAITCFKKNDFSAKAMEEYNGAVDKKFGRMHRKRARISHFFSKQQWVLNTIVRILNHTKFMTTIIRKIILKLAS